MASFRFLAVAVLGIALGGCTPALQPLMVALAGAGTSTAIGHSLNGTAYRTFTSPLADVKAASLDTLSLMGIRIDGFETVEQGELIRASASRRTVEIELEPISAKATRIRVTARNGGFIYDSATATEIVLQTEKALGGRDASNSAYGANAPRP